MNWSYPETKEVKLLPLFSWSVPTTLLGYFVNYTLTNQLVVHDSFYDGGRGSVFSENLRGPSVLLPLQSSLLDHVPFRVSEGRTTTTTEVGGTRDPVAVLVVSLSLRPLVPEVSVPGEPSTLTFICTTPSFVVQLSQVSCRHDSIS